MPQYRRKGYDFTTMFDTPPSPDHWEPVEEPKKAAPVAPVAPDTKES